MGVRLCTLWGEHCTIEADLCLPYPSLAAVKDSAILCNGLYQLDKVPVMLFSGIAINADVVMDDNDT